MTSFRKCFELVDGEFRFYYRGIIIVPIILIYNLISVNSKCLLRNKTISKNSIGSLLTVKWTHFDWLAVQRHWYVYPGHLAEELTLIESSKCVCPMSESDHERFLRGSISTYDQKTIKSSPSLNVCIMLWYKTTEGDTGRDMDRDKQVDREKLVMAKPRRLKWNQGLWDKTLQREYNPVS